LPQNQESVLLIGIKFETYSCALVEHANGADGSDEDTKEDGGEWAESGPFSPVVESFRK